MPSVAIVGPDGAGKTTITRLLVQASRLPLKYVYMGINVQACNHVLPTTLWVERVKSTLDSRQPAAGVCRGRKAASQAIARFRKGRLWAAARLLNRLADEWYRQLTCWYYQWLGFIVVFDRHFVFDFAEGCPRSEPDSPSQRIHRWFLNHLYPRPDLVILLDAPAEILYARKPEWSLEELEQKRQALIRMGKRSSNFFSIDATQPRDAVYEQVIRIVADFIGQAPGDFKTDPLQAKENPC